MFRARDIGLYRVRDKGLEYNCINRDGHRVRGRVRVVPVQHYFRYWCALSVDQRKNGVQSRGILR